MHQIIHISDFKSSQLVFRSCLDINSDELKIRCLFTFGGLQLNQSPLGISEICSALHIWQSMYSLLLTLSARQTKTDTYAKQCRF